MVGRENYACTRTQKLPVIHQAPYRIVHFIIPSLCRRLETRGLKLETRSLRPEVRDLKLATWNWRLKAIFTGFFSQINNTMECVPECKCTHSWTSTKLQASVELQASESKRFEVFRLLWNTFELLRNRFERFRKESFCFKCGSTLMHRRQRVLGRVLQWVLRRENKHAEAWMPATVLLYLHFNYVMNQNSVRTKEEGKKTLY